MDRKTHGTEKGVEKLRRAQLIDTDALRKLCKSATPGPWEQINHIVFTETGDLEWVVANARSGNSIIDAEYIAAANPATVLALLDEIDKLLAALTEIAELDILKYHHAYAIAKGAIEEIEALKCSNS